MKNDNIYNKVSGWVVAFLLMMSLPVHAQVSYQRQDSIRICQLLAQSNHETTTLWLARQFLGVPYVAHTLEVNDHEQLVVNTRQLDCTTFVETVTALKMCALRGQHDWKDYLNMMRQLRYRRGVIDGYPSRLHYFTDWIEDKKQMQLIMEIESPNPPFSAVQTVDVYYMSEHPEAYKALKADPSLISAIRQSEKTISGLKARYIPKSAFNNQKLLRKVIEDGDIIAITCNKKGLDIAHLGFAVWHKDGLHLLNASLLHHKLIDEPMTIFQYMKKHKSFTGIRVLRINNVITK